MSVIKSVAPEALAFINSHYDLFASGLRRRSDLLPEVATAELHVFKEFREVIASYGDSRFAMAVSTLVRSVFPSYDAKADGAPRHWKPQGLARQSHANYWARFLSQPRLREEERDQVVLRAIRAWMDGEKHELLGMVHDERRFATVENFSQCFTRDQLCELLLDVCTALEGQSARGWEHGRHYAIVSMRRMMQSRTPRPDTLCNALVSVLRRTVPKSLPLAYTVVHWLSEVDPSVQSVLPEEQSRTVTSELHSLLVSTFDRGDSNAFIAALRGGESYLCLWACWGLGRLRANQIDGLPFDNWEKFADVLVTAAETDPENGLDQLVPFVTTTSDRMAAHDPYADEGQQMLIEHVFSFDEARTKRLFDFDRLMSLFARSHASSHWGEEIRARFETIRAAAVARGY
jgi:hypothetical protein